MNVICKAQTFTCGKCNADFQLRGDAEQCCNQQKEIIQCKHCSVKMYWDGGEIGGKCLPIAWESEECGEVFCEDCVNTPNADDEPENYKYLCRDCGGQNYYG
jgi:hypothetical protein